MSCKSRDLSESDFLEAYERLSEVGACDAPLGMEYRRVLGDWYAAGKPANLDAFIRARANMPPLPSVRDN